MSFWRHLPTPIVGLAPMDGVTDAAFRQIVAIHGRPDVVFTEFTNVGDICLGKGMGFETLRYSEFERPIVAQVYGKEPALFYQAAQIICELGFDGLDINMGCPSKNVAASGSGAGLIRTPELALKIIASTKEGIKDWSEGQTLKDGGVKSSIIRKTHAEQHQRQGPISTSVRQALPVSVKTRLGFDKVIIDEWSECLAEGGPEVISIHGRTLAQMYKGEADWEAIRLASRIIQGKGILALGNGDIRSPQDAIYRIHSSAVDGVLIGRGALGNPWIFQEKIAIRHAAQRKELLLNSPTGISLHERFNRMVEHASLFEEQNGRERFPRMRKHLAWYCSGFPHAAAMRAQMVRTTCTQDVEQILTKYLDGHTPSQISSTTHAVPTQEAGFSLCK